MIMITVAAYKEAYKPRDPNGEVAITPSQTLCKPLRVFLPLCNIRLTDDTGYVPNVVTAKPPPLPRM